MSRKELVDTILQKIQVRNDKIFCHGPTAETAVLSSQIRTTLKSIQVSSFDVRRLWNDHITQDLINDLLNEEKTPVNKKYYLPLTKYILSPSGNVSFPSLEIE